MAWPKGVKRMGLRGKADRRKAKAVGFPVSHKISIKKMSRAALLHTLIDSADAMGWDISYLNSEDPQDRLQLRFIKRKK